MNDAVIDSMVREIHIPPCPEILNTFRKEIQQDEPNFRVLSQLIARDPALSVGLLMAANSPAFGLARKCESIDQAIQVLGLKNIANLFTQLILKKVLNTDGPKLLRFWDVSAKRSHAMYVLARQIKKVPADVAQSFGIFCDVGIPLLMQKFPDYGQTLKHCNEDKDRSFTEVEQAHHHTDHALIGSFMAKTWGLSDTVCMSIRYHHQYDLTDAVCPENVQILVALNLLAELSIQKFAGLNNSSEWEKGADFALGTLMMTEDHVEDIIELVIQTFVDGQV